MSSRGSTTIGFERRFNPMASIAELDEFVAASATVTTPKPPNLARIVELNRGPFLAAQPRAAELPLPTRGSQLLDVRPVAEHLAGHLRGAINVPVSGASFSTKAGFVLDAAAAVTVVARTADEAQQAITGLHSVAFLDVAGFVLGAGPETTGPRHGRRPRRPSRGRRDRRRRSRAGRAGRGIHPGEPQRPVPAAADLLPDLPEDRPIVTICNSGPRAAIAASILRARGLDARPVVDGGMSDWLARGATTVSFRRCGS